MTLLLDTHAALWWWEESRRLSSPAQRFPALMARHDFQTLAIPQDHALRAGLLPGPHGDPFDRMIAAPALIENLTVVTRDPKIAAFGCRIVW